MKAFILVGSTGSGKTFLTKQIIKGVNRNALFVFDVNGEYQLFYPYPFNPNMGTFLSKFYDTENDIPLVKNAVILIEDATSFFSTRGHSETLTKMLVAKRHTNNTIILLFHGLQDVPKYLLRKCTDIFVFKTLDNPKYVDSEFNYIGINTAWHEINDNVSTHPFFGKGWPWKNKPAPCPAPYKRIELY